MFAKMAEKLVGERGFEPPAPASRRQCSTRLSYSPTDLCAGGPARRQGGPLDVHFANIKRQSA
jgi:hypothetical protein